MRKIVVVLVLSALAILAARIACDTPIFNAQAGVPTLETTATATPPLMYAGIRG
jgi:hypothetical protein